LSFYLKFNIDQDPGRPPDGLRIEASNDGGLSWISLNLGVRAIQGVSGTETDDLSDGVLDGRTYTGMEDTADSGTYWVPADSVSRIVTDLSDFAGQVIILRFRVVTNIDTDGHYDKEYDFVPPEDEFRGIYLDDIVVYGESQSISRSTIGVDENLPWMELILSRDREIIISDSQFSQSENEGMNQDRISKEGSAVYFPAIFMFIAALFGAVLLLFGRRIIRHMISNSMKEVTV
jgi:hypothetical protein